MSDFYVIARFAGPSGRHIPEDLFVSKANAEEELARKQAAFPSGQYTLFDSGWAVDFGYTSQTAKSFTTQSTTFEKVNAFYFPGTDAGADPNFIRAIGFATKVGGSIVLRVMDVTHSQQIGSDLTIAATESTLGELLTLTNLPAEGAIFELEAKAVRPPNGNNGEIEYFEMR